MTEITYQINVDSLAGRAVVTPANARFKPGDKVSFQSKYTSDLGGVVIQYTNSPFVEEIAGTPLELPQGPFTIGNTPGEFRCACGRWLMKNGKKVFSPWEGGTITPVDR